MGSRKSLKPQIHQCMHRVLAENSAGCETSAGLSRAERFREGQESNMDSFQHIIERLLFAVDASRALFQVSTADGGISIKAEAVRRGLQQIRHGETPADTVDPVALKMFE